MVKDVFKMVIALLIAFAILAGLGYYFFYDSFLQLKNSMTDLLGIKGMAQGITHGVGNATRGVADGITGVFRR